MVQFGYTLMTEQSDPRSLVRDAVGAEAAGFDFEVISDHYFPWLDSMGHSPNAWPVLGAVAHATESVELMTYVTCPTMRYHPAVIAQQAATVGLLSEGRFLLGLGAGENLNEHVIGAGWPSVSTRHERLREAAEIIRALFSGESVNYLGRHYRIDNARLWDVASVPPDIGIATSGPRSARIAGELGDAMIAVEPRAELGAYFDRSGGEGKRRIGQVPICWSPDRAEAVSRAHDLFRWFGGGWPVNSQLPDPAAFAAATTFVTEQDVAGGISCGPDIEEHVAAVQKFIDAGFTDIAVVQIGGDVNRSFWNGRRQTCCLRLAVSHRNPRASRFLSGQNGNSITGTAQC